MMKERITRYLSANNTQQYVDVLNSMVSQYSHTKHSCIRMTSVMGSKPENKYKVYMNLHGNIMHDSSLKPKLKIHCKRYGLHN